MSYPQIVEYNEAVQHPQTAFSDSALRQGEVELNTLGLPFARSGGFALTYRVTSRNRRHAVRCFHRQVPSAEQKYDAITRALKALNSGYFVDFNFQPSGIRVSGKTYPIVCMDWVEGPTLGLYLDANYRSPDKITSLRLKFQQLCHFLASHSIAHGDIQNGNLIVSGDELKLIDYDGMYVPGLQIGDGSEVGHKHFQHPERDPKHFGPKMDRFSFIAVDLSLHALLLDASLYKKYNEGGETIILRANDFLDPENSEVIRILQGKPQLKQAANNFSAICLSDVESVPSLPDFLAGRGIPKPRTVTAPTRPKVEIVGAPSPQQYIGAYPVADARDYNRVFQFVGDTIELVGKVVEVKSARSRRGTPYVFVNFGPWKGNIVKLTIWSDGLTTFTSNPSAAWIGRWVSVVGLVDAPYVSRKYRYSHLSITVSHQGQINFIDEKEALYRLASIGKATPRRNTGIVEAMLGNISQGHTATSSPAVRSGGTSAAGNQAILTQIRKAQTGQSSTSSQSKKTSSATWTSQSTKPPTPARGGFPWWGWALAVLFLLYVFSGNGKKERPAQRPAQQPAISAQPSQTAPRANESAPFVHTPQQRLPRASDAAEKASERTIGRTLPSSKGAAGQRSGAPKGSTEKRKEAPSGTSARSNPGTNDAPDTEITEPSENAKAEAGTQTRSESTNDTVPRVHTPTNAERQLIAQACNSARYGGAAPYQDCLRRQISALNQTPSAPDLSAYSSWERQTMETACSASRFSGPASYYGCLDRQVAALRRTPSAPDLSAYSSWERQTMETACSASRFSGPASYYGCLDRQVAALRRTPSAPDLSAYSSWERQTMETACSASRFSGPASYYGCLDRQVAALQRTPISDLSDISEQHKQAIQSACLAAAYSGPASFYGCVNRQLRSLGR